MTHLKFHGKVLKQYHGIDKDTVVVAGPGDVIQVSEAKADRLLKDFPSEFELHRTGHAEPKELPEEPPADLEPEPEKERPETDAKDFQPLNKMVTRAKKKGKRK